MNIKSIKELIVLPILILMNLSSLIAQPLDESVNHDPRLQGEWKVLKKQITEYDFTSNQLLRIVAAKLVQGKEESHSALSNHWFESISFDGDRVTLTGADNELIAFYTAQEGLPELRIGEEDGASPFFAQYRIQWKNEREIELSSTCFYKNDQSVHVTGIVEIYLTKTSK